MFSFIEMNKEVQAEGFTFNLQLNRVSAMRLVRFDKHKLNHFEGGSAIGIPLGD